MGLTVTCEVRVAAEVMWGRGWMLACRDCGATRGWRLRAGTAGDRDLGETAEAVCPAGHVQEHPGSRPADSAGLADVRRGQFPQFPGVPRIKVDLV